MAKEYEGLRKIWRHVTLAVLLVISAHIVIPMEMPLAAKSGSAFSAFTADVALGCREHAASRQEYQPDDWLPPVVPVLRSLSPEWETVAGGPDVTWQGPAGPPPRAKGQYTPLNPRAPPPA